MRTLLCTAILLTPLTLARADDKSSDPGLEKFLAAGQEMATVLKGVKDKETATVARDKVVKLHEAMVAARKEMRKDKPAESERKAVDERIRKAMAPFDAEFVRLSLLPEAFAVFADIELFRLEAEMYELEARMTAVKIDLTVSLHKIQHGKYPADLKTAFDALKRDQPRDPWGREYQYDAAGPRSKAVDPKADRPDVWVVSPYWGGKKLLGNWDEPKK
jgi:hypothetical protein